MTPPLPRADWLASALVAALFAPCAFALSGCHSDAPAAKVDPTPFFDSTACRTCHPVHYDEWAGSMHAYASEDPVFLAMNRRGQRETNGALGDFCVRCHAPLALREGKTHDGLNLAEVPTQYKGVSCYFCHSIESVAGTHDNPLGLAEDAAMLGPISDPIANPFHASRHAATVDSSRTEAAAACGSCHDIVNPKGTAIERTFAEWNDTVFAKINGGLGCAACHMPGRDDFAALNVTQKRRVHDHRLVGLDVATTTWPDVKGQRQAIDEMLGTAVQATLCLEEGSNRVQVLLDNVGVGHMWPSGAASDRRAWIEVQAFSKGQVIYQSGVVPEGTSLADLDDPDLWLIRDCFFDEQDRDVHMFWEASRMTSNLVPATLRPQPTSAPIRLGHLRWDLPIPDSGRSLAVTPDRIVMRVLVRPIGDDVTRDLIKSGDLDPTHPSRVPTFEVPNTRVEWTPDKINFQFQERGTSSICVAPAGFRAGTLPALSQNHCDPLRK